MSHLNFVFKSKLWVCLAATKTHIHHIIFSAAKPYISLFVYSEKAAEHGVWVLSEKYHIFISYAPIFKPPCSWCKNRKLFFVHQCILHYCWPIFGIEEIWTLAAAIIALFPNVFHDNMRPNIAHSGPLHYSIRMTRCICLERSFDSKEAECTTLAATSFGGFPSGAHVWTSYPPDPFIFL